MGPRSGLESTVRIRGDFYFLSHPAAQSAAPQRCGAQRLDYASRYSVAWTRHRYPMTGCGHRASDLEVLGEYGITDISDRRQDAAPILRLSPPELSHGGPRGAAPGPTR